MKYIAPELEVIVFESEDIITASNGSLAETSGDNNYSAPGNWWN